MLSPKSTVRFSFVSIQAISLLRIFTCLIQSFNGRNSAGVKHPEMAVVTGTNTGLTWKSYMVSDNISAENWDKYNIKKSSKSQLTIENMTWRFPQKGKFWKERQIKCDSLIWSLPSEAGNIFDSTITVFCRVICSNQLNSTTKKCENIIGYPVKNGPALSSFTKKQPLNLLFWGQVSRVEFHLGVGQQKRPHSTSTNVSFAILAL